MKCPKCGKENDEGVSICQHCDFILDPSFLGEDYEGDQQADSGEFAELNSEEFSEVTPSSEQDEYKETREEEEEEEEKEEDEEDEEIERQLRELREKRGKHSVPHSAADLKRDDGTQKDIKNPVQDDLKKIFHGIATFFMNLQKADRIAMLSAVGMFLFTIFPWVSISNQGSLSGLEVGGWFLLLLGASLGALVYLRQDSHWQSREKYIIFVQAAVTGIALIFMLIRVVSISSLKPVTSDGTALNSSFYSVQVGFGYLFALASTVGSAIATWMLLKEKVLNK